MFELMSPVDRCNTARMWRVIRSGELVALFVSRADAIKWIEDQK